MTEKSRKGAISLSTQSLYAIFLVIFVAFVAFSVVSSRTSVLEQRNKFTAYDDSLRLLTALINSPCLVVDYFQETKGGNPRNYQVGTKGYLSVDKLNLLHNENKDVYCVDNFRFLYTLDIEDLFNRKTWRLGLRARPGWITESIDSANSEEMYFTRSFPIALNYNFQEIHPGYATLTVYAGTIPSFYGSIKLACVTRESATLPIKLRRTVRYNSTDARFCVNSECFFSFFPCRVKNFSLAPGSHILFLKYLNNTLEVVS